MNFSGSFPPRDGIPPYRVGSKKQLQREMHRSVKANGQVSLPHFPVSPVGRRLFSVVLSPEAKNWEVEWGVWTRREEQYLGKGREGS